MPTPLAHEKVMGEKNILLSLNSEIQYQQHSMVIEFNISGVKNNRLVKF